MRPVKLVILTVILLLVVPQFAMATITFDQLDDDTFIISHKIKVIGSRGKAMKLVYEKAASLCVAAGYAYLEILDQESDAGGQYQSANASARVQFFFQDDEGRIECLKKATEKYIAEAKLKLDKRGYQRPELVVGKTVETATNTGSCTIDQIATMLDAGLTEEQIKAACKGD